MHLRKSRFVLIVMAQLLGCKTPNAGSDAAAKTLPSELQVGGEVADMALRTTIYEAFRDAVAAGSKRDSDASETLAAGPEDAHEIYIRGLSINGEPVSAAATHEVTGMNVDVAGYYTLTLHVYDDNYKKVTCYRYVGSAELARREEVWNVESINWAPDQMLDCE